ncbi:hypothetical protein NDU88_001703 [Pleurodeles waltl]|uniref:Uncharacterized protein n=1 Tax=Pleurodeles waltl TaxID=8319 RepID=A0AAV7RCD0_PLEWA|nr:hypothetical protein NDU88_001703 [Pleurodeles waltl]
MKDRFSALPGIFAEETVIDEGLVDDGVVNVVPVNKTPVNGFVNQATIHRMFSDGAVVVSMFVNESVDEGGFIDVEVVGDHLDGCFNVRETGAFLVDSAVNSNLQEIMDVDTIRDDETIIGDAAVVNVNSMVMDVDVIAVNNEDIFNFVMETVSFDKGSNFDFFLRETSLIEGILGSKGTLN